MHVHSSDVDLHLSPWHSSSVYEKRSKRESSVCPLSSIQIILLTQRLVAVLLGFIKQLVPSLPSSNPDHIGSSTELLSDVDHSDNYGTPQLSESAQPRPKSGGLGRDVVDKVHNRERMVRSMRTQIWTGAVLGGLIAALIGAVFLFVVGISRLTILGLMVIVLYIYS